jgi:hypothetical protein
MFKIQKLGGKRRRPPASGRGTRSTSWCSTPLAAADGQVGRVLITSSTFSFLRRTTGAKGCKWLPKIVEAVTHHGGGITISFSVEFEQEMLDLECGGGTALAEYKAANPSHTSRCYRASSGTRRW